MYSPILQRHIALVRVRLGTGGAWDSNTRLEVDVNHKYEYVWACPDRAQPALQPDSKDGLT